MAERTVERDGSSPTGRRRDGVDLRILRREGSALLTPDGAGRSTAVGTLRDHRRRDDGPQPAIRRPETAAGGLESASTGRMNRPWPG
ncbi:hypothetical protein [Streptomyces qinzhouensis]|uniref:Uncharacterized protein n=1 Tax=Streptomyces qinzhouensis TaxID=2599401 RepID=A0A5B8J3R5_9ACTN|nr:hypothetical protein [Streptomyces qinzhouensis]QDY75876.1 hypothetical protein FQU76_04300 [Streptomyces qinzhouensis]